MTYLLGLIVLVVWGMIIYRVFDAAGEGDDDKLPPVSAKLGKEPYNDFSLPKDTSKLLLNYRDPFGLIKQKEQAVTPVKKSVGTAIPTVIKPAINWSFINYSGYISNPGTKKLIALVSINGQNMTLTEGEIKNQVKLVKNMRDSIKVSFDGKTKFIVLKPSVL